MTPAEADQQMDNISSAADPCSTLWELLDIMGQNPELFEKQIERACQLRTELGCEGVHPACPGES